MKDQAERFPTVVTSHAFNMRQTSFCALHPRVPVSPITQNQRQNFRRVPNEPDLFTKRGHLGDVIGHRLRIRIGRLQSASEEAASFAQRLPTYPKVDFFFGQPLAEAWLLPRSNSH
jgi:hypothetical protein